MKKNQLPDEVLRLLDAANAGDLSAAEICAALELRGNRQKSVQKALGRLIASGHVKTTPGHRFASVRRGGAVVGVLSLSRSGDGFVSLGQGRPDLRIAAADLGTAWPGDRVEVAVARAGGRGAAPERARVLRVVERGRTTVVGTLKTTGRFLFVVPLDPAYPHSFRVPNAEGARPDDRVVVGDLQWPSPEEEPSGRIVEVLGPSADASLDTLAILREYAYPEAFVPSVLREAEGCAARLQEPGERTDWRDRFILTIDPVQARDFDDALSFEIGADGHRILGVHIADVSHFVRPGTRLDAEAQRRGNSVYLPDRVLPMLPPRVSNELCSLIPGEDRLAFSAIMTFDGQGRMTHARFERTVIRSALRLTYEQAMAALAVPEGAACPRAAMDADRVAWLKSIHGLAQQLRALRFRAGALDLDVPEYEILLREDGRVADVRPVPYDPSHQLIEECMVQANEAVDLELSRRDWPLIHRIHEPPKAHRIEDLTIRLQEAGLQPADLNQRRNLTAFLKSTEGSPLAVHVRTQVLRSMCKAVYSVSPKGHFGLAKRHYAHFTSPIRRYPDLVVHRILGAALERQPHPYGASDLARIASQCSDTEQQADQAERDLLEIKKYRLLEQELAEGHAPARDAVVVRVMDFGLFVELTGLQIQGLVPIALLCGERRRRPRPLRGVLQHGLRTYRAGTLLRVVPVRVDFDERKIDFAPA